MVTWTYPTLWGWTLGVQGTSPSSTATPTDGTTEGYVASLKFACGGKNEDGDPSEKIATVA
jgi:hypothetical protein